MVTIDDAIEGRMPKPVGIDALIIKHLLVFQVLDLIRVLYASSSDALRKFSWCEHVNSLHFPLDCKMHGIAFHLRMATFKELT